MPSWLADLQIETDTVLAWTYVVSGLLALVLLVPVLGLRGRVGRRLAWTVLAAGLGAALGWGLVWFVVDVQDLFGAPASLVIRGAVTLAGALIGVAVADVVKASWWRRVVAVIAVPAIVAGAFVAVNRDVAYYPTLGDAFGQTGVGALTLGDQAGLETTLEHWKPPADMPTDGTVGTVSIPGTISHWKAREAWVYLPPAAHTAHPPKLPVVIAMSGEPGGPSDVFEAGGLQEIMDDIAAKHEGVAPIVVVPDQLGSYSANPMCLDSPLGQVAKYITVDVRHWILDHLPVSAKRREWTVAGFSQGATCAVQFATEYPALFGSFVAVSPELGPFVHSVAETIKLGFGGDAAAYRAALPIAVMEKRSHYPRTVALYSVGALDRRYGQDAGKLAAVSKKVGMRTTYRLLPDLAHNWNTGSAGLEWGLPRLTSWWGLP